MHQLSAGRLALNLVIIFLIQHAIGINLELLLIAAIFFSLYGRQRMWFWASFLAGVLMEVSRTGYPGAGVALLILIGFLAKALGYKVYRESIFTQVILVGLAVFIFGVSEYFFLPAREYLSFIGWINANVAPAALKSMAAAPIIFWLLKWTSGLKR